MSVSENYIEDLIATKAETFGSESGITSVPKVVEINSEIENATKSMDGLDPDQGSGSDRSISKDENGKNIITYGVCSECGKPLEKPTKDNLCSLKCQMAHNMKHITQDIKSAQDKAENVQGKISNITDATNALMGILANMVGLLAKVQGMGLDPKYLNYFTVKINTVIQYAKKQIEFALISKNQKYLDQLNKGKNGMDTSAAGLTPLKGMQKAIDAAQKMLESFQKMYDQIYQMVCSIKPLCLQPESLHFAMTPRSMMKIPGQLVNKLDNYNVNDSCGNVLFADQIDTVVRTAFPSITEAEYLMAPGAFNVRKKFSPENLSAVLSLLNTLTMLLKGPTEPLPKYEDLKITNIWFMLFLILSWGPMGLKHFAFPIYPP